MYANALKSLFSALAIAFWKIRQKRGVPRKPLLPGKGLLLIVCFSAALSGSSYLLQLTGAKTLPASMLYPMVTGGSIVLSALVGRVFFKEKLGRAGYISIGLCLAGTMCFL